MTDRTEHDVWVLMLWAVGFAWFCLFVFGCVTRTVVCVETAHGIGHRDSYGGRPDSVGGSVCVDIERP